MMNLSQSDLDAFKQVAKLNVEQDEFTQMLPDGFGEVLKEAIAEDNKQKNQALAKKMLELLKWSSSQIVNKVSDIRDLRSKVATKKSELNEINRAFEYAKETSNFLPLLALRGDIPRNTQGATIPEDWEPKEKATV